MPGNATHGLQYIRWGESFKGRILTAEGLHEVCPPKKSLYLGTGQMDQDVCVGENCQRQQMIHTCFLGGDQVCRAMVDEDGPRPGS